MCGIASNDPLEPVNIALPSFIHRVGRETADKLKLLAANNSCRLARVRRSRHWQLQGIPLDIQSFVEDASRHELNNKHYFISKVSQGLEPYAERLLTTEQRLHKMLVANPSLTINEMMHAVRCSEAEARRALHLFEDSQL